MAFFLIGLFMGLVGGGWIATYQLNATFQRERADLIRQLTGRYPVPEQPD